MDNKTGAELNFQRYMEAARAEIAKGAPCVDISVTMTIRVWNEAHVGALLEKQAAKVADTTITVPGPESAPPSSPPSTPTPTPPGTKKRPSRPSSQTDTPPTPKRARLSSPTTMRKLVQEKTFGILRNNLLETYLLEESIPKPEDLRGFILKSPPRKVEVPEYRGEPVPIHLKSTIVRTLFSELHWNTNRFDVLVHKVFVHDHEAPCQMGLSHANSYCTCPRKHFFRELPTQARLWNKLRAVAAAKAQHILDLAYGLEKSAPAALITMPWEQVEVSMEQAPYWEDVLAGLDEFIVRATEVCNRANVVAAVCSPSTFLEALLLENEVTHHVLDNSDAEPYLRHHPFLKDLVEERKQLLAANSHRDGNSIYETLYPLYERLSKKRGLEPLIKRAPSSS